MPGASEVAVLEAERRGGAEGRARGQAGGRRSGSQRGWRANHSRATMAGRSGHGGQAPIDLEAAQTVGIGITFCVDGEWATTL